MFEIKMEWFCVLVLIMLFGSMEKKKKSNLL